MEAVVAESNTYVFAHDSTQKRDPSLVALRMQDKTPVHGGLGLRKDSGWQLNSIFQPLTWPQYWPKLGPKCPLKSMHAYIAFQFWTFGLFSGHFY